MFLHFSFLAIEGCDNRKVAKFLALCDLPAPSANSRFKRQVCENPLASFSPRKGTTYVIPGPRARTKRPSLKITARSYSLPEFEGRFSTDQACRDYLVGLRWPHGFVCPRCEARTAWAATRGRLVCGSCRHQTSVTAGTIFQDTRKPLRLWFRAMWYVTSQKSGASAMGLTTTIGSRKWSQLNTY